MYGLPACGLFTDISSEMLIPILPVFLATLLRAPAADTGLLGAWLILRVWPGRHRAVFWLALLPGAIAVALLACWEQASRALAVVFRTVLPAVLTVQYILRQANALEFYFKFSLPVFTVGRVTKLQVGNVLWVGRWTGLADRFPGTGAVEALVSSHEEWQKRLR